ncbi:trichohyalin-like isoform X1 [Centruroides vittatus]|uniref:trichohyalin-like isoform X1 n=1 Tax=Centruroides vittatus TaxID=120091 RepID=UPI00350FC882
MINADPNGKNYEQMDPRPPSEQLCELHIYIVPRERWIEKRKLAKREVTEYSVSSGFVRVVPHNTLTDLRKEIYRQLGYDVVPKKYVFLRNVGRNFTQVRPSQEMEMKVKNYLPPHASEPEIYLKEGTYTGAYWAHIADDSGLEESVTESNSQPSREDVTSPDSFGDSERILTTDVFMPPLDTGVIHTDMAITMATTNNANVERKRRTRRQAKNNMEKESWSKAPPRPNDLTTENDIVDSSQNQIPQSFRSYRRKKIYQKGSIVNGSDGLWTDWRDESRFRKDYNRYEEEIDQRTKSNHQKRDRSLDTLSRIPVTVGQVKTTGTNNSKMRAAKSMSSLPVRVKDIKNSTAPTGGEGKRKTIGKKKKAEKKEESVIIENTSIRLVNEDGKPETNGSEMVQYVDESPPQDDQIVRHHVLLLEGEDDGGTVSDAAAETIRQVQMELGRSRDKKESENGENKPETTQEQEEKNEQKKEESEQKEDETKTKEDEQKSEETKTEDIKENENESSSETTKTESEGSKPESDPEIKPEKEKPKLEDDVLEHHLFSGETLQSLSRDGKLQIEVLVKELLDGSNDVTIDALSRGINREGKTNRFGYDLSKIRRPFRDTDRYGRTVYSPSNMRRSRSDGYGLASREKMGPETPAAERSHRQRLAGTGQWLSSVDIRGHEYYITERERLLLLLDRLRSELRLCETRRDELLRRIKHLQTRANHRRDQVRELWRKRYLDAKKVTPKLEEDCSKMRQELERLHRELLAKVQAGVAAILVASGRVEKPSNKLSYKIMIARLLQEIEDLRRRVEGTRLKLSAEIKLRIQAEKDVKSLREELLKKKIQVTLTRHQEQAVLGSTIREQYFISTV